MIPVRASPMPPRAMPGLPVRLIHNGAVLSVTIVPAPFKTNTTPCW